MHSVLGTTRQRASLARLAEPHLLREPDPDEAHFAKTLALAIFISVAENQHHERRADLPIPGAHRPEARIAALVERANAFVTSEDGGAFVASEDRPAGCGADRDLKNGGAG